jgi:uncharacterized protein YeeX (DUF496 family)
MIKINLRKASHLVNEIHSHVNSILSRMDSRIDINEYHDPEKEVKNANIEYLNQVDSIAELRECAFQIKIDVGRTNAKVGINDLLTEKFYLEMGRKTLRNLTEKTPAMTMAEIKGRVEKLTKKESESRYDDDFIRTSCLSKTNIDIFKKDLRTYTKGLRDIDNKLLEANIKNSVTLGNEQVELLEKEGLL